MQILIAFVVMGLIGVAAVVLVAAAALIRLWSLLVVVLVVVGAVRWWGRRGHTRTPPSPPRPHATPRPAPSPWPTMPRTGGWVLVPVWMDPSGRPQRRPDIDAEVISVEQHDG
jgi:uncharacterized iron-regulated membrane protein